MRSYGKTELYTLSISLYGTPSRHVFKMTSLVVMRMRFELVVHKKVRDLGKSTIQFYQEIVTTAAR